jgi:hypothetical protein
VSSLGRAESALANRAIRRPKDVHRRDGLAPDKLLRRAVCGDLHAGSLASELRPEIDEQLDGRLSRLWAGEGASGHRLR